LSADAARWTPVNDYGDDADDDTANAGANGARYEDVVGRHRHVLIGAARVVGLTDVAASLLMLVVRNGHAGQ
jgi:hypothetical protein